MTTQEFKAMAADRIKRQPTLKDPGIAFEDAIADGRLSADRYARNYAGHYMYMGTWDGRDSFKHIGTREYLR